MKFKFYEYEKCSSCVKASKWMDAQEISYDRIPIREQPPSLKELDLLLEVHGGNIRKLFNSSGMDYRTMQIKDRLPNLSNKEVIHLLHENGNLIKRPILIGTGIGLQGFHPENWEKILK